MEYVLLMTACIAPQNVNRYAFRENSLIRYNDYKRALLYWLSYNDNRITGILFAENSGFDLNELQQISEAQNLYNREIEILQFKESQRQPGIHYGYSEMEIIDYVIDNSKLLKPGSILIKTTGRLYFPRLKYLLNVQDKKQYDFFADSRDYKLWKKEKHDILTTIFLVQPWFYKKYLYNAKLQLAMNNCHHMEPLYFRILKPLASEKVRLRFPFNVNPVGVGAHWNIDYTSPKKRIESLFRSFFRKLLPGFKI